MVQATHFAATLSAEPRPLPAVWLRTWQGARRQGRDLLASYGLVLFGLQGWQALCLLLATFLQPQRGALGLLGLLSARGLLRLFAPGASVGDLQWIGCNGLLIGLTLALLCEPSIALAVVIVAATLVAVLVAAALKPLADRYLGVPLLSLPFVLAAWLALLGTQRFTALHLNRVAASLDPTWLPTFALPYLRSLGVVFLQPSAAAGALVLVGLLGWSRWATVLTVLGFASAWGVYAALGGPRGDLETHFLGFNAILCALATGGVFVVLSPASLLLATIAGALSTLLGAALLGALGPLHLPVLAAPLIAVTDAVLLALLHRIGGGPLQLVVGTPGRPEDNLGHVLQQARRYPAAGVPLIYLPVLGRWLVTQGPDGELTHRDLWAHAWDFEVADDAGQRWRDSGNELTDYFAFGAPVVAPADGRIARAVGHLDDNAIGHVDTANNWGNTLVIAHAGGIFSALSHLQRGSLLVREGDTVVRGQVIARVGNSGRSPVPHLHVQLQASPDIGAPTLAGEFLQFLRSGAGQRRYVTHGSPQTGDVVEALQPDEAVRRAFALPPSTQWRWRVQGEGMAAQETWLSDIDGLGRRHLRAGEASAALYIDDAYATVLEYQGAPNLLLALYALVAARVPFLKDPSATWHDSPSALVFLSPLQRAGVELLLPFSDRGALSTQSRLAVTDRGLVVSTRLEAAAGLPDRLELVLHPDQGPVALRAWRGDKLVVQAEVIA